MIDIFIEECDEKKAKVYFVQLGIINECLISNLEVFCDNVVSLYTEFNMKKDGTIDYYYLPVTDYHNLYKSNSEVLFSGTGFKNIPYTVKKVCV